MCPTISNIGNNTIFALNQHSSEMLKLQEQAASGNRINRASDDPSPSYQILGLNSQHISLENYIANLQDVNDMVDSSATYIKQMMDSFAQIKVLLAGVSGASGGIGMEGKADIINQTLVEMVSLANSNYNNQYLYGGSSTGSEPYSATKTNGDITAVTYNGNLENREIEVAPGVTSSAFEVGDNVFKSNNRSDPVFVLDNTGVANGTGTSNVNGYTWLEVTYNNVSGKYEFSIDGGLSKVEADGSGNLAVTDSVTGKILYIDDTNVTATGNELVNSGGTHDIFEVLITLRDIFVNDKNFSQSELETLRKDSMAAIEEVNNLLIQNSVSLGSKSGFLGNLRDNIEDIKFNTSDEITRLQEADIAQISIDLAKRQVLYQMSLSVAGKLMSMSLLDFLK